jgi:hypothetical protein
LRKQKSRPAELGAGRRNPIPGSLGLVAEPESPRASPKKQLHIRSSLAARREGPEQLAGRVIMPGIERDAGSLNLSARTDLGPRKPPNHKGTGEKADRCDENRRAPPASIGLHHTSTCAARLVTWTPRDVPERISTSGLQ